MAVYPDTRLVCHNLLILLLRKVDDAQSLIVHELSYVVEKVVVHCIRDNHKAAASRQLATIECRQVIGNRGIKTTYLFVGFIQLIVYVVVRWIVQYRYCRG